MAKYVSEDQKPHLKEKLLQVESTSPIETIKHQLNQQKRLVKVVNLQALPDKGQKLMDNIDTLESQLRSLELEEPKALETKSKMASSPSKRVGRSYLASANLEMKPVDIPPSQTSIINTYSKKNPKSVVAPAKLNSVKLLDKPLPNNPSRDESTSQQYHRGRMTNSHSVEVRDLTEEALVALHNSLSSCPSADLEESDPPGLKTKLMPYQRKALKWLLWRELQEPHGGILADDMGLGKTLTMLSLVLKDVEKDLKTTTPEENGLVHAKTTLVICPASLIGQWSYEIFHHLKWRGLPGDFYQYHGPNREKNPTNLAARYVIITSYNLVQKEVGAPKPSPGQKNSDIWRQSASKDPAAKENNSPLMKIRWNRIILDEGHTMKNPKCSTALAVSRLTANNRWVVTGTPVHNDLLDLYGLIRFLRCAPFDEYEVWKNFIVSSSDHQRLEKLVKSLLLRRTKDQLDSNGKRIVDLPNKEVEVHYLNLLGKEKEVYDKILSYSKSALSYLLKKKEDAENCRDRGIVASTHQKGEVNGAQILSLLLRMQQCCSHLSLLRPLVDGTPDNSPDGKEEIDDILEQMSNLNLKDETQPQDTSFSKAGYSKIDLSAYKDDKDFQPEANSSKICKVMKEIKKIQKAGNEKCVLVSQWTSMLNILGIHLNMERIKFRVIQGIVNLDERDKIMKEFNENPDGPKVVLLSLKAGGVGLNLIGGNHLFLIDTHWNPALENQACDRIYRIGQTKNVKIHKLVCRETIEEHIIELQQKKMSLATKIVQGGKMDQNRLTLQDLKVLFGVSN